MPLAKKGRKRVRQAAENEDFSRSEFCSKRFPYVPRTMENIAVSIDNVRLDEKNPRKNDKAAKQLSKLIRRYGFRKAIVVDQTGLVRAGHTAVKAARILRMSHIPATQSEFTEEQSTGYMVSDNAANEYSSWDNDMLMELIQAGQLSGPEQAGFSEKKWRTLEMSDDLPPDLVPVTIRGESMETGDFLIIRFPNSGSMEAFKKHLGMGKTERALDINKLAAAGEKLKEFQNDTI